MSAISVVWTRKSARTTLEAMLDAQAMYGGFHRFAWDNGTALDSSRSSGQIALGGHLMQLLPEDRFDRQPLWSADGSACMVADVRLDNREDLVRELSLPHPEELADSTILMEAWMRWGEACLDHIVGAFAFAIWQPKQQTLFAARDHAGERPLFYHRGKDFFALASMPKGLLAIPGVFQGFQEQRLVDCIAITHPDWTKSFFSGVERLPLGHFLRVTPESFEVRQYWHPCNAPTTRFQRDEEYVDAMLDLLDKATAARLRSTRGIAAQLSAGLDSSSIVAAAARLLAPQGKGLTAFTSIPRAGFLGKGSPGRLIDEGAGAADVAAMYPTVEHRPIDSAGRDLLADMKGWTDAMDEPAQNCVNLLWISAIMDQARAAGAGVMLHGACGNATVSADGWEAMTGYFRRLKWLKLYEFATALRTRGELSYKASIVLASNGLMPRWMKRQIKPGARMLNLDYTPASAEIVQQYDLLEKAFQKRHGDLPDIRTQRALFFERFDHGPMNAAVRARYGLDNRDPMGDKRVWEYCFSLPVEQYAAGAQSRSLVRRAMKGRLPEATLARTIRGQQGVDWYLTVAEALPGFERELPVIEQSPTARRFLDLARLKKLVKTWPETGYETNPVTDSWNYALTRGVSIGYLLRKHDVLPPAPPEGHPEQSNVLHRTPLAPARPN
jgi:asparagine synthase (glutamine-hydrolysing)